MYDFIYGQNVLIENQYFMYFESHLKPRISNLNIISVFLKCSFAFLSFHSLNLLILECKLSFLYSKAQMWCYPKNVSIYMKRKMCVHTCSMFPICYISF